MPGLECPNSVFFQFPEAVYRNVGSSTVLPQLLAALNADKLTTVQFLQGGRVRVTCKDRATCDDFISRGLVYADANVPVFRAHVNVRSVHVRDLPSEITVDDVKAFFQSYGDVLSIRRSTFPNFPSLYNGNRVVEVALDHDIPYFVTICECKCRVWYARQPAHCTICRQSGHRGPSCPLSGLCGRCHQAGHMARECKQAWSVVYPGTEVLLSNVPVEDPSPDYSPPPEGAPSEASEGVGDDQLMSGDEVVVADAPPPSPPPAPVTVCDVPPVPVQDVPPVDVKVSTSSSVPPAPTPVQDTSAPDVPPAHVSTPPPLASSASGTSKVCPSTPPVTSSSPTATVPTDIDPHFVSCLRKLPPDHLVNLTQQGIDDLVSCFVEKNRTTVSSFQVLCDYVYRSQRKLFKKIDSSKKSVKRLPAKPLESDGPPPRKPTRPDRVPSKSTLLNL